MKNLISRAADAVNKASRGAACTVETSLLEAKDSVLDKCVSVTGAAVKIYHGVVGTVAMMVELGVVVAAVTAPVPTAIGICLLWLLKWQLNSVSGAVNDAVKEEAANRKLKRVTGLLKKYGSIPETANLKTDTVSMVINSRTGEVTGSVLAGAFKGRDLDSLTDGDLVQLIESSKSQDSKDVFEAYQALRNARAETPSARPDGTPT